MVKHDLENRHLKRHKEAIKRFAVDNAPFILAMNTIKTRKLPDRNSFVRLHERTQTLLMNDKQEPDPKLLASEMKSMITSSRLFSSRADSQAGITAEEQKKDIEQDDQF